MASERDRLAYKAWQAELAAEEVAEKERVEKPIREMTEKIIETKRKIYRVIRERLEHNVDEDETGTSQVFISPAIYGMTMPWDDAVAFVVSEYRKFIAEDSEWYWDSTQNRNALISYLQRNGIQIADAEMLRRAARRLNDYNLLEEVPPPIRHETPFVNFEIDRSMEPPTPVTHEGYNPETGEKRIYSDFEVRRMSSEQYRRAFRLYKSALELPREGPRPIGFRG